MRTGESNMRKNTVAFIVVLLLIVIVIGGLAIMLFGKNKKSEPVELGELMWFNYSPGYGDMNGSSHSESLEKGEDGKWVIVKRDRNMFSDPMEVTTYAVSDEALKKFLDFVREKNVLELCEREDSNLFITDYSAWYYGFTFDESSIGGSRIKSYNISQYKEYTDEDYKLLKELDQQFADLHGEVISQSIECN